MESDGQTLRQGSAGFDVELIRVSGPYRFCPLLSSTFAQGREQNHGQPQLPLGLLMTHGSSMNVRVGVAGCSTATANPWGMPLPQWIASRPEVDWEEVSGPDSMPTSNRTAFYLKTTDRRVAPVINVLLTNGSQTTFDDVGSVHACPRISVVCDAL